SSASRSASNAASVRFMAGSQTLKSPPGQRPERAFWMVGVARIELATPAMSTQCSTTELHALNDRTPLAGLYSPRKHPKRDLLQARILGFAHAMDFEDRVA